MTHPTARRAGSGLAAVAACALAIPTAAAAGPTIEVPASWNQPHTASAGSWWTTTDAGNTVQGKANADYPSLAHLTSAYCNPYGPATQLVGARLTRVRWHANANDMFAYVRFLTPAGIDLGVTGGLTSLLSTRRYLYDYAPEGVNLQLGAGNVTTDAYSFPGGQCVHGGVLFNGAGSNGVVDTPGWTPLVTNRLDAVVVEDLQGPQATSPTSWSSWITGDHAPIEWDQADNQFNRGTTGASVVGGASVDLGNPPDGHAGAWVGVGSLADGQQRICAYRTAGTGYPAAQACAAFKLDRNDPAPPTVALSPDAASGWTSQDVTIQTAATADGSGSGWDRNQFSVDGGPWTDGPADFTRTAEGAASVRARAVDKAGRVSAPSAARTVRIDRTPPIAPDTSAWTAAPTPDAYRKTVALPTLADLVSGLARVEVQVNSDAAGGQAEAAFVAAGHVTDPGGTPTVGIDLSGQAGGTHATRIVATDRAGNTAMFPGPPVTLPPAVTLTSAGGTFHATSVRADGQVATKLVGGRVVPVVRGVYNRRFVLRAHLQLPDGTALAGAPVELRDSAGRYVTGARTDAAGNIVIASRATIGGAWTINQVGRADRLPVVYLEVRPIVTVRMSVATRSGVRRLSVTGRVIPQAGMPGKVLQLQWRDPATRAWRPAVNGRVGANGRFRLGYGFRRPGGYRVAFRVVLPRDTGWPYLPAVSRTVGVRVP
jgi:hypothetical protein